MTVGVETAKGARVERRNFNFLNYVIGSNLETQKKNELLIKETEKTKTMQNGYVFMTTGNREKLSKFKDFLIALKYLQSAERSELYLPSVDACFRNQIKTILDMGPNEITNEEKSLCLFTLQNMTFALNDLQLKNGKENTYVPQILKDQHQMLLAGANEGLTWDKLNNSVYSNQYQDKSNPVLATFQFLDQRTIQSNIEKLKDKTVDHDDVTFFGEQSQDINYKRDPFGVKVEKRYVNTDNFFQQLSNEGTLDCLSKIFAKYDKHQELINNIKNDEKEELMKQSIPDLFNFTRDVLTVNNTRQVEHEEIHKVANMLLHFAVEMGHNKQQSQAMMQQFNQEKEQSL